MISSWKVVAFAVVVGAIGCAVDVPPEITSEEALAVTTRRADVQVSPDGQILDPEFDPASNRFVYCQPADDSRVGSLYVGAFDSDGTFAPGTPVRVDDCLFAGNGPEWAEDARGPVVVYMKQDATTGASFIAYTRPPATGVVGWSPGTKVPTPELDDPDVVYGSTWTGLAMARVVFMSKGNLIVQDLRGLNRWTVLEGARGNFPRFSEGNGTLFYTVGSQVFSFDVVTGTATAMPTTSARPKNTPASWFDPVLGKQVYGFLEVTVGGSKTYDVYTLDGTLVRSLVTKMPDGVTPADAEFASPERFVYNGKSYLYYGVSNGLGNVDLHIVDTNTGVDELVSGSGTKLRVEPEIGFPSGGRPILFFSSFSQASSEQSALWRTPAFVLP